MTLSISDYNFAHLSLINETLPTNESTLVSSIFSKTMQS